jgi:hypothetical protein
MGRDRMGTRTRQARLPCPSGVMAPDLSRSNLSADYTVNVVDRDNPTLQKSQIGWAPRGAFFLETTHGPSSADNPDAPVAAQRTAPQHVCRPLAIGVAVHEKGRR